MLLRGAEWPKKTGYGRFIMVGWIISTIVLGCLFLLSSVTLVVVWIKNFGNRSGKIAVTDVQLTDTHSEDYDNGYSEGYDEGYDEGNIEGYNEGYDDGYDEGYNEGYNEGCGETEENDGDKLMK